MSKVVFQRTGESGNIYYIMWQAVRVLRKEGRTEDAQQMWNKVLECDSYDEALQVIAQYVELEED